MKLARSGLLLSLALACFAFARPAAAARGGAYAMGSAGTCVGGSAHAPASAYGSLGFEFEGMTPRMTAPTPLAAAAWFASNFLVERLDVELFSGRFACGGDEDDGRDLRVRVGFMTYAGRALRIDSGVAFDVMLGVGGAAMRYSEPEGEQRHAIAGEPTSALMSGVRARLRLQQSGGGTWLTGVEVRSAAPQDDVQAYEQAGGGAVSYKPRSATAESFTFGYLVD